MNLYKPGVSGTRSANLGASALMRLALTMYGDRPLSEIGRDELLNLMDALDNGVKAVTVRGRMSVLRTVLRWASEKGYCDPVRFPKLPDACYEKFVPPTPEELAAMLAVASPHIQRVIIIGSNAACR